MTMETGQQVAPQTDGGAPPDPDAAKYEALRREIGIEEQQPEPEVVPAPEPAATEPEPDKALKPEIKPELKPEHVPYGEHENLQKALKAERDAKRQSDERLAQFMRIVEDARAGRGQPKETEKAAETPQLPDVQADPIGHFTGRIAQLEETLRQANQGGQQDSQQIRQHLQEQALWTTVQASEADIRDAKSASHKADYDDACRHLETSRVRQLDRMYPSDSPQVLAVARQLGFPDAVQYKLSLLNQDRRAVAEHALQTGISPAQLYYDLALDSGYQPKAAKQEVPAIDKARQQVETLKRGKAASLSISGGGTGKGAENMSIADLTDMMDDDPEAAMVIFRKMGEKGLLG